jgi:nitrate reductase delta subunit
MTFSRSAGIVLPAMRGFINKSPEHSHAVEIVRGWVRTNFRLPDDSAILVAELECALPGCPPLETVIAFWSEERRHHFKIFKPVAEVVPEDLPPYWLRGAFVVPEDWECGCC